MKVLIMGQNALGPRDYGTITAYIKRLMRDADVEEILFALSSFEGRFNGMTCVAETSPARSECGMHALESALTLAGPRSPRLSAVLQSRQNELPDTLLRRLGGVGGVYEFEYGLGYNPGYVRYVQTMPELVADSGQVTVFWDGNFVREPWPLISSLRGRTLRGAHIAFEVVELEGPPAVVHEASRSGVREEKRAHAT